jgi:hypothetical protein
MSGRHRFSLRGLLRRLFDRALTNTFGVQMIALTFLTVVIAGAGTALAMYVLGRTDFGVASWWAWIRVVDPSMLQTDAEENRLTIAISATIVICGWIVFGLLISIITTAFQERLERIKAGTTELHVSDHTIVLGWNSTVFAVIDQLSSDDEHSSGEVVVMAETDPARMRAEADEYCTARTRRHVHFRQGEISSVAAIRDLKIADARQVIILGPEDIPDSDATGQSVSVSSSSVFKALLACFQACDGPGSKRNAYRMPIVALVDTAKAARAVERGAPASVRDRFVIHAVHTSDFLARLTAQIAAEPELARVYNELLSYEGALVEGIDTSSEIYVVDISRAMIGLTFEQCVMGYDRAIPIGYMTGSRPVINPIPGTADARRTLVKGDRIIAVANRKLDVVWRGSRPLATDGFVPPPRVRTPQRLLVLGDGVKTRRVLERLPQLLPPGSTIATRLPTDGLDASGCSFVKPAAVVEPSSGAAAPGAYTVIAGSGIAAYDRIVVVDDSVDAARHDARILMDLADIQAAAPLQQLASTVVIELLDYRNVELARAYGTMAAVVSSQLASNLLVQLASEPDRAAIFAALLDPEGSEIHVRPAAEYFSAPDEEVSFDVLLARSRKAGCLLIGYLPPGTSDQLLPSDRTTPRPAAQYGTLVMVSED